MLRITTVTFRNFLSVGSVTQTVNLSLHGLTLVLGENLDLAGQRNGCGKTILLQAISYGFFGEPLTNIKLDNLINHFNNKAMLVTIDFEVDGKGYVIERGRKPNVLRLFVDGSPFNQGQGENSQTQAEIERIIGMSHLMFSHVLALNTYTDPFMKLKTAEQRKVIEELLGITQLSVRAAALKVQMDRTKDDLKSAEAAVKATQDANARIQQAIIRAQEDAKLWQIKNDGELAGLTTEYAQLRVIDIEAELGVFDQIEQWQQNKRDLQSAARFTELQIAGIDQDIVRLRHEMARYEADAARTNSGEIVRLEAQRQRYLTELTATTAPQIGRLQAEAARYAKEADQKIKQAEAVAQRIGSLQDQLSNPSAHTCTTCGQQLEGTDHLQQILHHIQKQVSSETAMFHRMMSDIDVCNEHVTSTEAEIGRVKTAHQQAIIEAEAKVAAIEHDIEVARQALANNQQAIKERADELRVALEATIDRRAEQQVLADEGNAAVSRLGPPPVSRHANRDAVWQLRQQRDALSRQIDNVEARPNPHLTKVDGLQSTLASVEFAPVNRLTLDLKHEMFLYKLLTAKDSFVRMRLIDRNLGYLNRRINHYLERLQLPHEVRFLPDLSVEISYFGKEMDFDQLSRGEQNRCILATWWAFGDVYENLNQAINLRTIDELLDFGLDDHGSEASVAILQSMVRERNKNVLLISHKENLLAYTDSILLAKKQNQFTTYSREDK